MRGDAGRDPPRDQQLALAGVHVCLHDRAGLRGGTGDVPGRHPTSRVRVQTMQDIVAISIVAWRPAIWRGGRGCGWRARRAARAAAAPIVARTIRSSLVRWSTSRWTQFAMSTATDRTPSTHHHFRASKNSGCAGGCWPGMPITPGICPGGGRAIRTASGSARSCCSRRRWRRSATISSGSWRRFPTCGAGRGRRAAGAAAVGRAWLLPSGPAAARRREAIVAEHAGRFPHDFAALQALPGIGRYTAGAIASIAFDQRAPILEANTIRLLSRLIAYRGDPLKAAGQRILWQTAGDILPQKHVARFNQALMELGSLVCTPTEPQCAACPLAGVCAAYAADLQKRFRGRRRSRSTPTCAKRRS